MGSHVKPRKTAPHSLYFKLALLEIDSNKIGNLQFATRGRFESCCDLHG